MLDPLLTLLAAKAKAVGLVAGTAMVTAALAGGGAVAMTVVSHDGTVHDEVVAEELLDGAPTALVDTSDTPTVGIEDPDVEEVETDENEAVEDSDVRRPLPADFVCDDSKNHGQNVSAYARSLEKGPGRGEKVSAVAQSDCGKTSGEDEPETAEEELSGQAEETEVEEPKPAKAEKAKSEKKAKPAKAQRSERSGKPEKASKGNR